MPLSSVVPFVHATCVVARPETREHGRFLREFWLTSPRGDWVEVDGEAHVAPRSRPRTRDRLLVTRGKLGELLAQEFASEYRERDALAALQADLDALRAGEDEARWSAERRRAIGEQQGALEDAFYRAGFPLDVTLVAWSGTFRDELEADFRALALPSARFLDASGRSPDPVAEREIVRRNEQVSL